LPLPPRELRDAAPRCCSEMTVLPPLLLLLPPLLPAVRA
jgi:hypothetical protein